MKIKGIITLIITAAALSSCTPVQPAVTTGEQTSPVTDPVIKEETVDIYKDGFNNNTLVGIDENGRVFNAAAESRENRDVGIFYFLWLGQPYATDIYDASKILEEYGKETLFFKKDNLISPDSQAHFWTEPIWGYYNSSDPWVMRKHIELLTSAGVDFLVFDTTNAVTYKTVYMRLLKELEDVRNEGWDTPQVAFYTHSLSIQTINELYESLYKTGRFESTWYRRDGKPLIIGYTDVEQDMAAAHDVNRDDYKPEPLSQEILDFFTIREARWPWDRVKDTTFPWTEWEYPQPVHKDVISVSVATHPAPPFSFSLTRDGWRDKNWGRGWSVTEKTNKAEDVLTGTFFESEWKTAIEKDPEMVFVTGWNEWIAYKQLYDGEYMLCDNADLEFSRDIEMMKGGYEDAYYIQLIQNVRKYKYKAIDKAVTASPVTIDINGGKEQWDDTVAVYRSIGNTAMERNFFGAARTVRYRQAAARNYVKTVRVTNDGEYVYFAIECENDIIKADDAGWMNIFIGVGTPSIKGWKGYDYVVNRSRDANGADICSLGANFSLTDTGANAEYTVNGNFMQVRIPSSAIGCKDAESLYFKIADGIDKPDEIMDYYVSGKSFPLGRLSYIYYMG